jgi:hypothetical protein
VIRKRIGSLESELADDLELEVFLASAAKAFWDTLVRIARDFVHSTINQLDSVSLRVAAEKHERGVKEPCVQYTH